MRGLKGVRGYALALGMVTAVVASAVWVQLGGATTTSTNPDTIQYVQTTGKTRTYLKYVPSDCPKST